MGVCYWSGFSFYGAGLGVFVCCRVRVWGGPGVAPPEDRVEVVGAGFYGRVTDPTPNANYTASMNDAPTPDTDPGWRKQAEARMDELASRPSEAARALYGSCVLAPATGAVSCNGRGPGGRVYVEVVDAVETLIGRAPITTTRV